MTSTTPPEKSALRARLAADYQAWLDNGNTPHQCEWGESGVMDLSHLANGHKTRLSDRKRRQDAGL